MRRAPIGLASRGSACTGAASGPPLTLPPHTRGLCAVPQAGTLLVSGSTEKAVRVWDPRSGTKQMKLKGHADNIRALAMDASGRLVLSGSSDNKIRLWDLGQQRCVPSGAASSRVGLRLAVPISGSGYSSRAPPAARDGVEQIQSTKLYPPPFSRCVQTFSIHADSVWALSASPTFSRFYSGSRDGQVGT